MFFKKLLYFSVCSSFTFKCELELFKLLKLLFDGDIESNPGPSTYDIQKKLSNAHFIKDTINLVKHLELNVHVILFFQYVGPL